MEPTATAARRASQASAASQDRRAPPGSAGYRASRATAGPRAHQANRVRQAGSVGAPFNFATPATVGLARDTAVQPRETAPCFVVVTATLTGLATLAGLVSVAVSATETGTPYFTATIRLNLSIGADRGQTTLIPLPAGHWIKATQTGISVLAGLTLTRTTWPST